MRRLKGTVEGRKVVITPDFDLTVIRCGSRWYVQWGCLGNAQGLAVRDRWARFRRTRAAGVDALGAFYRSEQHADSVVDAFAEKEAGRRTR